MQNVTIVVRNEREFLMRHDNRTQAWVLGFLLTLVGSVGHAAVPAEFPERVVADGKTLVKNGEGLRTATIFNVKVYRAALYLPEKNGDAEKVLASPAPKRLEMRFFRDVSVADMRNAWDENFRENCTEDCEMGRQELEKVKSWMRDAKEGDVLAVDFRPDGVKLAMNGETLGRTTGSADGGAFSRQLLGIWLGQRPPNGALKEGLLGR
jgi:hypothetical protein